MKTVATTSIIRRPKDGADGNGVIKADMTDTTRVTVDSMAVMSLRQTVGFAVDSCAEWVAVEFGDSGGWLRIDGGVLAAGGVKGFRGGRKSGETRLYFAVERLDSTQVGKVENRGVAVHETLQVRNGKTVGWFWYCLVFGMLLAGAMWCLLRKHV